MLDVVLRDLSSKICVSGIVLFSELLNNLAVFNVAASFEGVELLISGP